MSQVVVTGASCTCAFGVAPATLNVTSQSGVIVDGKPAATIQDCQKSNLATFGMCSSLANPQVAAATAAALGVLTPQPCNFIPAGTWIPTNAKCMACKKPILTNDAKLMCGMGMGMIGVVSPGQFKVML